MTSLFGKVAILEPKNSTYSQYTSCIETAAHHSDHIQAAQQQPQGFTTLKHIQCLRCEMDTRFGRFEPHLFVEYQQGFSNLMHHLLSTTCVARIIMATGVLILTQLVAALFVGCPICLLIIGVQF